MNNPNRTCPICYKIFQWSEQFRKYCSKECQLEARRRQGREKNRRYELKKQGIDPLAPKQSKLDEALENAKTQGLSYAEYQKQKTIAAIRKGEL